VLTDTAVGQALVTTIKPGWMMSTIQMDVKYFKPIAEGRLHAVGRIVRKGKRVAHGDVELTNDAGELVGRGWCVYALFERPA